MGALQLAEVAPRRSFKDVLLVPPVAGGGMAVRAPPVLAERKPWAPVFQMVHTPYLIHGKAYGPQPERIHHDEEDGIWDLLDSVANCKHSVSVTRSRSISMLTPIQAEKKAIRIASMKMPPVIATASD